MNLGERRPEGHQAGVLLSDEHRAAIGAGVSRAWERRKPGSSKVVTAERDRKLTGALRSVIDAVIWMTGANDFALPDGETAAAWVEVRDTLRDAMAVLDAYEPPQ